MTGHGPRTELRVAVAIPCHRVTAHVLAVIAAVPDSVCRIYAVDDACPDHSGRYIREHCADPRVEVIQHAANQGVGGAVRTAYQRAMEDGMDIVVKIDGDGQMDPALVPLFVRPIRDGVADYTKGNRFFRPESTRGMPPMRLVGNAGLSFLTKLSCGYWNTMDPTNGYTAVHVDVLRELPLDKVEQRYFFETDMLFRLGTLRAVVQDIPMHAHYGDEVSGLRIHRVLPEFLRKQCARMLKRYAYAYLIRDFNVGTLYSLFGAAGLLFALAVGIPAWVASVQNGLPASSGTVMLAALPAILGVQFLVAFLQFDIAQVPRDALHPRLRRQP